MIKFVIVSPGRTGSQLLKTLLQSHSSVRVFGEAFHSSDKSESIFLENLSKGIRDPIQTLNKIYEEDSRYEAKGFKILYNQARGVRDLKTATYSQVAFGNDSVWHELQEQSDIKIIHSIRDNGLARVISFNVALTSQVWHYDSDKDVPFVKIKLDPKYCEDEWSFCEKTEKQVDNDFSKHSMFKIEYKNLFEDIQGVSKKMQDFLGIKIENLTSQLKKINSNPFDHLENYEELKCYFKGTKWDLFFFDHSKII
jgi:LPS sulfotransferase NodH